MHLYPKAVFQRGQRTGNFTGEALWVEDCPCGNLGVSMGQPPREGTEGAATGPLGNASTCGAEFSTRLNIRGEEFGKDKVNYLPIKE